MKPSRKRFGSRVAAQVPKKLLSWVKVQAERDGTTVAGFIRHLVLAEHTRRGGKRGTDLECDPEPTDPRQLVLPQT